MATFAGFLASLALGGMAFFTFVMAPLVFGKLTAEQAGAFMRHAFQLYYPLMAGLTGFAALTIPPFWPAAGLAVVAIGFVLAHLLLRPELNTLADARAAGDATAVEPFRHLHGLSMMLNIAQMIILAIVVWGALSP